MNVKNSLKTDKALKPRQIAFWFIAFLPVTKLATMQKTAAAFANEDLWISVLLNILLDLVSIAVLIKTNDLYGKSFYTILEDFGGTVFAKTVLGFYFLFFIAKAFPSLIETSVFVQNTLYETSPTAFSFVPFFITATYICSMKLRAIGRVSDVVWLLTLIGVTVIIILSFESADFYSVLPIGANGINILIAAKKISPWFSDSAYFLFLIGKYNDEKRSSTKILSGFAVASFITLFFSVTFYAVFEGLSGSELFPLAEISKFSSVINAIGRFDYFGIFLITFSTVIATSIPIFFAARLLKKITEIKKTWISVLPCVIIEFIAVIILKDYYEPVIEFIHEKLWIWFILLGNGIPLTLPLLAKIPLLKKEKNEQRHDGNKLETRSG